MDLVTIAFKLLLAFFLSIIYGLERQRAHKPISFGAFTFVAVGSCALGITAITMDPANPLPLLAAAVTGIGFLGAGALIKTSDKIFGFTTAASIWLFAVLGLMVGVGEYRVVVIIYLMIVAVVWYDKVLQAKGIGSYQKRMIIQTSKIVNEREIESAIAIGSVKFKKMVIDVNKKEDKMTIAYLIEGRKEDINQIPQKLYEKHWFAGFHVE